MLDDERQLILDQEHLRLLRIGYYISAGTTAFFSLFGLLYVFMGIFIALVEPSGGRANQPPPAAVGLIFAAVGGFVTLAGATLATLKFFTARALGNRRASVLCFITAGISCIAIPYGTLLGICTFLVLSRPSVQTLFVASSKP
ncbi:MAG TPA: hypothetical protein DCE44_17950 [Verrucomicrobiales bacterium]|nr:hypothetical protein [Verrucomicrobiales bacterium]